MWPDRKETRGKRTLDGTNILIVDDDIIFRENLKESLLYEGFSTITTSSGTKVVDLVTSNHFNLVITDLRMPKMDGTTFVKR